jgi:hypothetical protein
LDEVELKKLLHLCRVYTGTKDNLSKNNLELFISRCGAEWTTFKLNGRMEWFIGLGCEGDLVIPKGMYRSDGELQVYPIEGEHMISMRTKSLKGAVPKLLDVAMKQGQATAGTDELKKESNNKKAQTDISSKGFMLSYVLDLIKQAAATSNGTLSERDLRKLSRLFDATVDTVAKDLLHTTIEKMGALMFSGESSLSAQATPDKVSSSNEQATAINLVTPNTSGTDTIVARNLDQESLALEVSNDDEEEEEQQPATTADEFIAELKEEVVLQSLLHRRVLEKKERVFTLEYKNGRRMLVVLPPDTQSAATFEEEANRTGWIETMLNNQEKTIGMLTYLAKKAPDTYGQIGSKRKLLTQPIVLDTAQTVALARVGNLNDDRLAKVHSFLRQVGEVDLKHAAAELKAMDSTVGLERTTNVTFGRYVHEWTTDSTKEKKPPELIEFWNCDLQSEIEAEVDMYLSSVFKVDDNASPIIPAIDYKAHGFDTKGVTVLIGGDHGDKNCPISMKIQFTSPQERKRLRHLSFHCPMVQFASVKCSKDTYLLLNSTIMKTIKEQLAALDQSSMVTVFNNQNVRQCYRSFMAPTTINKASIAFRLDVDRASILMTYSYDGDKFGSIALSDPFTDVPHYHLEAKVVICRFNQLYIGDLAFLAMLLGMNSSSGSHCLLCLQTAAKFSTCNHFSRLTLRTKESLEAALVQHLLNLQNNKRKKPPANHHGVNCKGLWDADPKRVIVPVLHCPMGLVDKALESFKLWYNLEVEDIPDADDNAERSVYVLAKATHKAAIQTSKEAAALFKASPNNANAKQLAEAAETARKSASKEETEAGKAYKGMIEKHNAKKASITQQIEAIYKQHGINRKSYHGGKFNGVMCIRVMELAEELVVGLDDRKIPSFLDRILSQKIATITNEAVEEKCRSFGKLFGLLDLIWSSVRGVEGGLLPTDEQIGQLERTLADTKKLWLHLGLTTLQPKWHLTFDGHKFATPNQAVWRTCRQIRGLH